MKQENLNETPEGKALDLLKSHGLPSDLATAVKDVFWRVGFETGVAHGAKIAFDKRYDLEQLRLDLDGEAS